MRNMLANVRQTLSAATRLAGGILTGQRTWLIACTDCDGTGIRWRPLPDRTDQGRINDAAQMPTACKPCNGRGWLA